MRLPRVLVAGGIAAVSLLFAVGAWMAVPTTAPAQPTRALYALLPTIVPSTEPVPASVLDAAGAATPTRRPELLAPVERILIPAIYVDAPIVEMNVTPEGALDVPKSPHLVAWYRFTGKPGMGGNAVMSGHVDYAGFGPAVFADLADLSAGDQLEVILLDGNAIRYSVLSLQSYRVADVPMAELLAHTEDEVLTLITCGGVFLDGHYTHRLVVRAIVVD